MVEFGLFLGTHPNNGLAFVMDLIGQFPRAIAGHIGNVFHQTGSHVLKGVEVIVEDNDFVVGVVLANNLLPLLGNNAGHSSDIAVATLLPSLAYS